MNKKIDILKKIVAPKQGFTLIELIVVVAITGMLSGILIVYSKRSGQQITLYVETAKIAQVIARAKSLAISTYGSANIPCGYGVHFGYGGSPARFDGTYEIFRYGTSTTICADLATSSISTASSLYARIGERYRIPTSTVTIRRVATPPRSLVNILFVPPEPTVRYWDVVPASTTQGNIYLRTQDLSASRTIRLNSAGQITF